MFTDEDYRGIVHLYYDKEDKDDFYTDFSIVLTSNIRNKEAFYNNCYGIYFGQIDDHRGDYDIFFGEAGLLSIEDFNFTQDEIRFLGAIGSKPTVYVSANYHFNDGDEITFAELKKHKYKFAIDLTPDPEMQRNNFLEDLDRIRTKSDALKFTYIQGYDCFILKD